MPSVKCAFFGTECRKTHLVPVPIRREFEDDMRADDLLYQQYVATSTATDSTATMWKKVVLDVSHFVDRRGRLSRWDYVIFQSDHVSFYSTIPVEAAYSPRHGTYQALSRTNTRVTALAGGSRLGVDGNVLVAQVDRVSGKTVPVDAKDLPLVEEMMIACVTRRRTACVWTHYHFRTFKMEHDDSLVVSCINGHVK